MDTRADLEDYARRNTAVEMYPQWYAFFYLTTRLGLRRGEVYAISRDRVHEVPPLLVVDRAVQEGYKERRAKLITRKNNRVLTLGLPTDVMDAIRWHVRQGFAGPEFLFSKDGTWPQKVNDHEHSGCGFSAITRSVATRSPHKRPPEASPSKRFNHSSATARHAARTDTRT